MEQYIDLFGGNTIITTRCPIRINGKILKSETGAPKLGQHNQQILEEMKEKVY
jgi:hypothetical protein